MTGRMTALSLDLAWEGRRVRVFGTPERPEWVAKDICRVLQIHNSSDAMSKAGVAWSEKGIARIDTLGGPQRVVTVVESGVWKLVMASRKPGAVAFKHWLAADVIPCLREHGCYPAPQETKAVARVDLDNLDQVNSLLEAFARRRIEDAKRIAELEPKAEGFDRLQDADGAVSLTTAGRILGRKPRKLIEEMELDGILIRGDRGRLMPAHSQRERGVFVIREEVVGDRAYPQTLVTPRGLEWLARRYPQTDQSGATSIVTPTAH